MGSHEPDSKTLSSPAACWPQAPSRDSKFTGTCLSSQWL